MCLRASDPQGLELRPLHVRVAWVLTGFWHMTLGLGLTIFQFRLWHNTGTFNGKHSNKDSVSFCPAE